MLDDWDRFAVADALLFQGLFCAEMAIKEGRRKSPNKIAEARRLADLIGVRQEFEGLLSRFLTRQKLDHGDWRGGQPRVG